MSEPLEAEITKLVAEILELQPDSVAPDALKVSPNIDFEAEATSGRERARSAPRRARASAASPTRLELAPEAT